MLIHQYLLLSECSAVNRVYTHEPKIIDIEKLSGRYSFKWKESPLTFLGHFWRKEQSDIANIVAL
jgi:hypothetical protein